MERFIRSARAPRTLYAAVACAQHLQRARGARLYGEAEEGRNVTPLVGGGGGLESFLQATEEGGNHEK